MLFRPLTYLKPIKLHKVLSTPIMGGHWNVSAE